MFKAGCNVSHITEFLKKKLNDGIVLEKLTIIDPYFFEYKKKFSIPKSIMLETLTDFTRLATLEIVTPAGYNIRNKEQLEISLKSILPSIVINVIETAGFHDRFWILNEEKGFVVGTSLNGMGNKHFFIQDDYLSQKDIDDILTIYKG